MRLARSRPARHIAVRSDDHGADAATVRRDLQRSRIGSLIRRQASARRVCGSGSVATWAGPSAHVLIGVSTSSSIPPPRVRPGRPPPVGGARRREHGGRVWGAASQGSSIVNRRQRPVSRRAAATRRRRMRMPTRGRRARWRQIATWMTAATRGFRWEYAAGDWEDPAHTNATIPHASAPRRRDAPGKRRASADIPPARASPARLGRALALTCLPRTCAAHGSVRRASHHDTPSEQAAAWPPHPSGRTDVRLCSPTHPARPSHAC